MVLRPSVAQAQGGILERQVHGSPFLHRTPVYRDRTAAAMVGLVAEVQIVLHPDERRKDRIPRPAGAPQALPDVEVLRHSSNGDHPVHGGAATHRTPTLIETLLLDPRPAGHEAGPLVQLSVAFRQDHIPGVHAAHRRGRLSGSVVGSGFEEKHRHGGVFGQARR